MKRLVIAALALGALVAGSSVALAGSTKTVSGKLTGMSEWSPRDYQATTWTIHGTYTSDALGSGTYAGTLTTSHEVVDATVEWPEDCFATGFVPCNSPKFAVTGSITFTGDKGESLTTTVAPGSWVVESDTFHVIEYPFGLNLDVSGGTRRLKHATGSLQLAYDTHVTFGGIGACVGVPIPGLDYEICGEHYDGGTLTGTIGH
jgi:hypothetical protein